MVCEIQDCLMTYRESETYNYKYLKNLPLQPVSSKGNLPLEDHPKIPLDETGCSGMFLRHFATCISINIRILLTNWRSKLDNWEGHILIYSCFAQLISFEIDCFDGLRTRTDEYVTSPPPPPAKSLSLLCHCRHMA